MSKIKLGVISKVDLRDAWKHEAKDFSEWLADPDNMQLLSDTVGIEIEVIDREFEVGKYRLDILAKESFTDNVIIIENQLEISDHDHLGKIITYGAGLNAKYIIWVLKDVRDEHLKAIQWLNDIVSDNIYLFLIEIELWKIDDSKPAPSFEILSQKNNWVSAVKSSSTNSESKNSYKESHELHFEFFTKFGSYITEKGFSIRHYKPGRQHYLIFPVKSKYGHVAALVSKQKGQNKIGVSFDIKNNFQFYDFVENYINNNDELFELGVSFYKAEKDSGFRFYKEVDNVFDKNFEELHLAWLLENVSSFINLYNKIIAEFESSLKS